MEDGLDREVQALIKRDKGARSISIRFPAEVLDRLRVVAEWDKRSINSEVIWIVQEYIEQTLRQKERDDGASD